MFAWYSVCGSESFHRPAYTPPYCFSSSLAILHHGSSRHPALSSLSALLPLPPSPVCPPASRRLDRVEFESKQLIRTILSFELTYDIGITKTFRSSTVTAASRSILLAAHLSAFRVRRSYSESYCTFQVLRVPVQETSLFARIPGCQLSQAVESRKHVK